MAVYTELGSETLAALIAEYDVGELVSAKGIADGISNSNWLIETTRNRFVLTMYERRTDSADLPFFLGLLDHLSLAGCAVPATIHDRDGAAFRRVGSKAVALIEFLPGTSPTAPSPDQARAVGEALAQVHLAAATYRPNRANPLSPPRCADMLERRGMDTLAAIDPALAQFAGFARQVMREWPDGLPRSVSHTDLFPDNVLMIGDRVTGLIDFYFAASEIMAYDLAVTHAAWAFDRAGQRFEAGISRALIEGYEAVRPLSEAERDALPILAQGACVRFVASRVEDSLDMPPDLQVLRKDPMDFVRRSRFYASHGAAAFA